MLPDDYQLDTQHQRRDWQQHQYLLPESDHSESESCETDHHYSAQRYVEDFLCLQNFQSLVKRVPEILIAYQPLLQLPLPLEIEIKEKLRK